MNAIALEHFYQPTEMEDVLAELSARATATGGLVDLSVGVALQASGRGDESAADHATELAAMYAEQGLRAVRHLGIYREPGRESC